MNTLPIPQIRPSSLPMLRECPRFERGGGGAYTAAGTERHKAAYELLVNNNDAPFTQLPEDDQAGVSWFVDYVRLRAPMSDHGIQCERQLALLGDGGEVTMRGTPDVVCGPHLFDLKWRPYDYLPQMAAYALMILDQFDCEIEEMTVHICYAERRSVQRFELNHAEAQAIVSEITGDVLDPDAWPVPCDYCGWCRHAIYCPALKQRVDAVHAGREDWQLANYHASEIEKPEEMGKAFALSKLMEAWCEAVKFHANKMAFQDGKDIPGTVKRTRAGNRFITDTEAAFGCMSMDQESYLKACEAKFTQLVQWFRTTHGMSEAKAKKEVEKRLGDLLQRKPTSYYLQKGK